LKSGTEENQRGLHGVVAQNDRISLFLELVDLPDQLGLGTRLDVGNDRLELGLEVSVKLFDGHPDPFSGSRAAAAGLAETLIIDEIAAAHQIRASRAAPVANARGSGATRNAG
jgi:hypothetical protein